MIWCPNLKQDKIHKYVNNLLNRKIKDANYNHVQNTNTF